MRCKKLDENQLSSKDRKESVKLELCICLAAPSFVCQFDLIYRMSHCSTDEAFVSSTAPDYRCGACHRRGTNTILIDSCKSFGPINDNTEERRHMMPCTIDIDAYLYKNRF